MSRRSTISCALVFLALTTAVACGDSSPSEPADVAKKTLLRYSTSGEEKRSKDDASLYRLKGKHDDSGAEGKFGKKDKHSVKRAARASSTAPSKREADRRMAMDALTALGLNGPEGSVSSSLGPGGLGSGVNESLGGLRGSSMGDSGGVGGLGLRGSGPGGGGIGVASVPSFGGTFVHAGTNPFTSTLEDGRSTFAVDVDTGSYRFARRYLEDGRRPPAASVRVEEWVNAMRYSYEGPAADEGPFRIHLDAGPSPFSADKHLLRVVLKGRTVSASERKATHLTFLVDVSGSMSDPDKLPLVRESLHLLVDRLRSDDSVALVTYAGGTRLALPATSARHKKRIHDAIRGLKPGGGTAMGAAMEIAYREAALQLSDERRSRVVVLSDGDANIGAVGHAEILKAVKGWVSEGVTLSTMGFGRGNYNDHLMEGLADAGNGNYTYVDSREAAQELFGDGLTGMLEVIAKDAKVQVAFHRDVVRGYRLIGYENRDVADEDFANDKVDGGEIGAGHSVTALYEIDLREGARGELATVHVRAKTPRGLRSQESVARIGTADVVASGEQLDSDLRFAAGVALVAEVMRGSPHIPPGALEQARDLVRSAMSGPHAEERLRFLQSLERVIGGA